MPSWLSHRDAKGSGCHAALSSPQRHFPVGVLYLSQPALPSKSRLSASKISTPLADFILPWAGAGLGHTIMELWDLAEMSDVSEPLVSNSRSWWHQLGRDGPAGLAAYRRSRHLWCRTAHRKKWLAPGEAPGNLVRHQSLEAQPREPMAGQGRQSGSLRPGRLRGAGKGGEESSWD